MTTDVAVVAVLLRAKEIGFIHPDRVSEASRMRMRVQYVKALFSLGAEMEIDR